MQVIYNGVHPDSPLDTTTRDQIRHEFGFSPNDFIVGTAGRFDPIKNLPLLLRSLAEAREEIPSLRGLVLGDGPMFDEIRALREDLQLTPFVAMPGHREDARELIQCMDLFVLSSFSEGTSLALLEAMSAGVPVAVTAVGGNPEIVIAGQTGWVVTSDCQTQLTAAILDAALNREKASRLGAAGRRRFQENFTFGRMIESYRAIYTEMLKSRQD
ncbi:glycosyltransferase family 4 protein [Desulforhabdus sp. TSK]|uniref:glycosyltransferase family 4 protein n=1 Tax=Desulforhabdus sp. TSK TaxID=2925014 RepID=UPI00211105D1|nr:glycosyltransferase family 4 protein [Desulforhabdus sp. TSK]